MATNRHFQRWECQGCGKVYDHAGVTKKGPTAVSHSCPRTMKAAAFKPARA